MLTVKEKKNTSKISFSVIFEIIFATKLKAYEFKVDLID